MEGGKGGYWGRAREPVGWSEGRRKFYFYERNDFMNNIELASKCLPVLEEIYATESLTAQLDSRTEKDFSGTPEVKVLVVETDGLGDYSRENGYPEGDVTATWETFKLGCERGKEFSVDRMDDEETLGLTFGAVTGEFERVHVVPEIDAYRFATYATGAGTVSAKAITAENIIGEIDEAVKAFDAAEIPTAGRILYISTDLKPVLNRGIARQWGSDATISTLLKEYNGMTIVYVPPKRFVTGITLGTKGFSKTDGAKAINFMLIHKNSVKQAKKLAIPKVFDPDTNQDKDAWKLQYRLYHDAFVKDTKKDGIYCCTE